MWIGLAGGVTALLLLPPLERQSAKGGDLALEIVRMGPDGRLRTPEHYLTEDRFKALVTCPPAWRGYADVLVFQAGETTAPLDVQRIETCGNRRTLRGAFQITGTGAATICAVLSESAPLDRSRLPVAPHSQADNWVCQELQPTAADSR